MAGNKAAFSGSRLFADKGTARPASGLRPIYPEAEPDEDGDVAAVPDLSRQSMQRAAPAGEPEPAASLQAGGFKKAESDDTSRPPPDAGERGAEPRPELLAAAGPATADADADPAAMPVSVGVADLAWPERPPATDASAATAAPAVPEAALLARRIIARWRVVVAALGVLVAGGLGLGYLVGTPANDEPTDAAIRSVGPSAAARSPQADGAPAPILAPRSKAVAARNAAPAPGERGQSVAAAPAGAGQRYAVQLGSLPDRERAQRLWRRVIDAHAGLFAEMRLNIQRVRLESRDYYRVQTGEFDDVAGALGFCQEVRARGLDCLVVKK